MAERSARYLFPLLALGCAKAPARPGAALVEVVRETPAASDYRKLGPVMCRVEAQDRASAEAREECLQALRGSAFALGADVVMLEAEPACSGCLELRATAYRRQLPFERKGAPEPDSDSASDTSTYSSTKLGTGTGFVVGTQGSILTANHVVDGARTIAITLADGRFALGSVSGRLPDSDLALIKITLGTPRYLSLGDSAAVGLGQRVWTMGFPVIGLLGVEPKFSDGSINSLTGINGAKEVFQVNVPIQPGNSGGPLLDERGLVVGVITSSAAALPFFRATGTLPQGLNWAVKSDLAKPMLASAPAPAPTPAAPLSDAIERTKAALCLIESVWGTGLLAAPAGFGEGLSPRTMTPEAFDNLRRRCDAGNAEVCLSVAGVLLAECDQASEPGCAHARYARTVLAHACEIGRRSACDAAAKHAQ